jgi:isopentenyl-diphosphate delta-isomerase
MKHGLPKVTRLTGSGARTSGDTSSDEVILADDRDVATGSAAKLLSHQQGLRQRAVSVIVRDRRGRLLLQRRTDGKYRSASLWSNTYCGHPRREESVADAARRRLAQEMGIACPHTFPFTMAYRAEVPGGLVEHEIVYIFAGSFDRIPDPDPHEVSDWFWRRPDELAADISRHPETCTTWFQKLCSDHWARIEEWLAGCDVPVCNSN